MHIILNQVIRAQVLDFEYYVETHHEKQLCVCDIFNSDLNIPHPYLLHDLSKTGVRALSKREALG